MPIRNPSGSSGQNPSNFSIPPLPGKRFLIKTGGAIGVGVLTAEVTRLIAFMRDNEEKKGRKMRHDRRVEKFAKNHNMPLFLKSSLADEIEQQEVYDDLRLYNSFQCDDRSVLFVVPKEKIPFFQRLNFFKKKRNLN